MNCRNISDLKRVEVSNVLRSIELLSNKCNSDSMSTLIPIIRKIIQYLHSRNMIEKDFSGIVFFRESFTRKCYSIFKYFWCKTVDWISWKWKFAKQSNCITSATVLRDRFSRSEICRCEYPSKYILRIGLRSSILKHLHS